MQSYFHMLNRNISGPVVTLLELNDIKHDHPNPLN